MAAIMVAKATQADIAGLVQCAIGLFAEDAGTRDITIDAQWPAKHAEQSLTQAIGDPSRLLLAARQDTDVIGSLSGVVEPATAIRPIPVATLLSLYVHPRHRNNGVGASLVGHFRSWAQQKNAARIAVTAYTTNEAAIRFYQRTGFTPYTLTLEMPA
jgi:GNAT superfamily N-acetyltransferase